ncbi:MAG TPA: hypothetical protein VK420_12140 [Longimicrobium sp.]|nr:hypothetical protein [Longimicrobium sp.]
MPVLSLLPLLVAAWLAPATLAPATAQSKCRAVASLPAAVRPFVKRGTCAIELESKDLDLDGRGDYLLVLEQLQAGPDPAFGRSRSLLVLTASAGGRLREAARNDGVVLCSGCGGVWGDPFEGVTADRGRFTVEHYGGSAWRWRVDYTFAYSRRDRAWQLVRVHQVNYHTGDPEATMKRRELRPPRDYGKVDLRAFDPDRLSKREW